MQSELCKNTVKDSHAKNSKVISTGDLVPGADLKVLDDLLELRRQGVEGVELVLLFLQVVEEAVKLVDEALDVVQVFAVVLGGRNHQPAVGQVIG